MTKLKTRIMLSVATATMLTPLMALTASAHGLGGSFGLKGIFGRSHGDSNWQDAQQKKHDAFGSVTAVSGTTLTVEVTGRGPNGTKTTISVDASGAVVSDKDGTAMLSDIKVGSMIKIDGEMDGSVLDAEKIKLLPPKEEKPTAPAAYEGDGSPVVIGKITAISGSTLTLDNKAAADFKVDASAADFAKGGKVQVLADVAVGDTVMVQGAVTGSNVKASAVIEQPGKMGLFGFLGHFFSKMFGA